MKRYHLILDVEYRSFPEDIDAQRKLLNDFIHEIVKSIDMSILRGPDFAYGSESSKGAQEGWSATTIIDFSSITIHHFNQSKEIKLDVFSCKNFDRNAVITLTLKTFNARITNEMMLIV